MWGDLKEGTPGEDNTLVTSTLGPERGTGSWPVWGGAVLLGWGARGWKGRRKVRIDSWSSGRLTEGNGSRVMESWGTADGGWEKKHATCSVLLECSSRALSEKATSASFASILLPYIS